MTLENPDNKSGGRPTPMQTKELALLHLIHSGVNSSRLELARKTGLSPASITLIVKSLIDKGIVVDPMSPISWESTSDHITFVSSSQI
jgi:DNA-binding MarR family transcriptional regulator